MKIKFDEKYRNAPLYKKWYRLLILEHYSSFPWFLVLTIPVIASMWIIVYTWNWFFLFITIPGILLGIFSFFIPGIVIDKINKMQHDYVRTHIIDKINEARNIVLKYVNEDNDFFLYILDNYEKKGCFFWDIGLSFEKYDLFEKLVENNEAFNLKEDLYEDYERRVKSNLRFKSCTEDIKNEMLIPFVNIANELFPEKQLTCEKVIEELNEEIKEERAERDREFKLREEERIRQEQINRRATNSQRYYFNHCWNCKKTIDSSKNRLCPKCNTYFICSHCGYCKCGYNIYSGR